MHDFRDLVENMNYVQEVPRLEEKIAGIEDARPDEAKENGKKKE